MTAPATLSLAGQTVDGKPVVSGVGLLLTTHGVPLEVSLSHLKERGIVPDWVDVINSFLRDGHKPQTIRGRILAAVGDVYGAEYLAGFEPRLDAVLSTI